MTSFRPVGHKTVDRLIALEVAAGQEGRVSPAVMTLAQAGYKPGAHVFGIWDGSSAVGLLAMVDTANGWPGEPFHRPGAAYLWRLLIDGAHQGRGYGRAAVAHAIGLARAWGYGEISLTYADLPAPAGPFYGALGFRPSGRRIEDEIEMVRGVDPLD